MSIRATIQDKTPNINKYIRKRFLQSWYLKTSGSTNPMGKNSWTQNGRTHPCMACTTAHMCTYMHAYNINHHCNNQVEMLQVQSGIIPKDFSQNCGLSVYCKVGKPVIKGLTFMPSVLKSIFELLM